MKTHVAIYDTREQANNAIKRLTESHFPLEKVSLIEKEDLVNNHIQVKKLDNIKTAPLFIFMVIGLVFGLLVGLRVISIPGFYFEDSSDALIGAFLGFDVGLIVGAIATIITAVLIKKDRVIKFHEYLKRDKFVVLVKGSLKEIKMAEHILQTD